MRPVVVLLLLAVGTASLRAQQGGATHEQHHHAAAGAGVPAVTQAGDFLRAAIQGSARFHDRREAISAGYRRIGPDFPGMGEHWIHLGVLVAGRLDPAHPTFLSYADIDGTATLVGVAYAIPLGPNDVPPAWPAGIDAWHDHTRSIDDEVLLTQAGVHVHPGRPRTRLAMLHAWVWTENADGSFAKENWALPFLRLGLIPPPTTRIPAARALSLTTNRAYYDALLAAFPDLTAADRSRLGELLDDGADRVRRVLREVRGGSLGADELDALAALWSDLWTLAERGQSPEVRSAVRALRGSN